MPLAEGRERWGGMEGGAAAPASAGHVGPQGQGVGGGDFLERQWEAFGELYGGSDVIWLTLHSLRGDQGFGVHVGGTVYRVSLCRNIRVRVRKAERTMWQQTAGMGCRIRSPLCWRGSQDSWSPTLPITDAMQPHRSCVTLGKYFSSGKPLGSLGVMVSSSWRLG